MGYDGIGVAGSIRTNYEKYLYPYEVFLAKQGSLKVREREREGGREGGMGRERDREGGRGGGRGGEGGNSGVCVCGGGGCGGRKEGGMEEGNERVMEGGRGGMWVSGLMCRKERKVRKGRREKEKG